MIDAAALTADAARLVMEVEDDLRSVLAADAGRDAQWREQHETALKGRRTSSGYAAWRDERITQVAVSWVLTTVFLRFCEDNALISGVWLSGPPARRQEAGDAQTQFFREHPELTDREWILAAVEHLASVPATAQLVDSHAPFRQLPISGAMAGRIVAFWRQEDEVGGLIRDLRDEDLSTRFLGDLYQDLSEHARESFALLQTPEFVEELILDETLEPALAERPLEGFRMIDPTCGSGHFLLGAFQRIVDRWVKAAPAMNPREQVARALESVNGVDLNPYAVVISRFRLLLAALKHLGETRLEAAPAMAINVHAGDSLLKYAVGDELLDLNDDGLGYSLSDLEQDADLKALSETLRPGQYDVVVGNPPYIVVRDKSLNKVYRELYPKVTKGQYQLTVPFMERFFQLAKPGLGDQPAGWTGQITGNAFMKREFGTKLIEDYLPTVDLRTVIDTSGAYIPGHGTPTVIVIGRRRPQSSPTVRAVLGKRGEPGAPENPAEGLVWSSIRDHLREPGYEDEFLSVVDAEADIFRGHPWNLRGGIAASLQRLLERRALLRLSSVVDGTIGRAIRSGSDEAFVRPYDWVCRQSVLNLCRELIQGEGVRDYLAVASEYIFNPYRGGKAENTELADILWSLRSFLAKRGTFQGDMDAAGRVWWEFQQYTYSAYSSPLSITFAFVATHNHFVLDRGGKVFNRSAPVIKLPEGASEEEHPHLLGMLNSSTALFWLKQNSHDKGNGGIGGGIGDEAWEPRYEFTGTTLQDFPLAPADFTEHFIEHGQLLDRLAVEHAAAEPSAILAEQAPSAELLDQANERSQATREQMIAAQEELDWYAYRAYGILEEDLTCSGAGITQPPRVRLGERAFEIALARRIASEQETTAWFERHRSTPITQIPAHWPTDYRELVRRRLEIIENNRLINLLERPEYKRRWAEDPWDKRVDAALRDWLLARLEERSLWFDPQGRPTSRSVAYLADVVGRDEELRSAVALWRGTSTVDHIQALTDLLADEAVPALAAHRFKDKAMAKFEAWEEAWQLQRRQDAGQDVGTIPVPPKYTSADYRRGAYNRHRGKLDVPKERFILYPGAGRANDGTPQLGWAGWDHAQQYLATAALTDTMIQDGAPDDRLTPLLATLREMLFWVEQWHDHLDHSLGANLAEFARSDYQDRRTRLGLTEAEVRAWRSTPTRRGRKKKA